MHRPCSALAVSLVLSVAVVGSCSSSADGDLPAVGDFRAGDCQTIAPDLLSIARDTGALGTATEPPQQVRDSLKTAQDRIRAVQPGLETDLAAPVGALVVAVAAVRLRSDTKSFVPSLGTELSTANRAVIDLCTG